MTTTRELVTQSWALLDEVENADGRASRTLTDFGTEHGPVLLAIGSEGTRHVLVPIGPKDEVATDQRSQGVQLLRTQLIDEGEERAFVDIRCPKPGLYRVFDQIAASMLDEIRSCEDPPPKVCARVLTSWRSLLRQAERPLSPSLLRGVFGELCELRRLCQVRTEAAAWWMGPAGGAQDFTSPTGSIEVKTSGRVPATKVEIHGLCQLDDEPHDFLVLVVQFALDASSGKNIPEVVDRIVSLGVASETLLDRLALVGLHDLDASSVQQARFEVTGEHAYLVTDEFPRLTTQELRAPPAPKVGNVYYELDLTGLEPLTSAQLDDYRKRFAGQS